VRLPAFVFLRSQPRRVRVVAITVLVAAAATVPSFASAPTLSFATIVLIYVGLAVSLDLVWGYTGILSLGHAAFFGLGAYTVGLAARGGAPPQLAVLAPLAFFGGIVAGIVIGTFLFAGRRVMTIIYVAIATLALSFIAERSLAVWHYVGASTGISGLPLPRLLGWRIVTPNDFYLLALGFAVLSYAVCRAVVSSPLRMVLTGIRVNEQRLQFLGYRTARFKVTVFAVSGGIAAVSGAIYAAVLGFASPTFFGIALSTLAMIWVLVGGPGTLLGPALGVVLVQYGSRVLSDRLLGWWQVALGVLLLLVVLFFRHGLAGLLRREAVLELPGEGRAR